MKHHWLLLKFFRAVYGDPNPSILLGLSFMCVCPVYACVWGDSSTWAGNQRTAWRSWFSPFNMWVPGPLGLEIGIFISWTWYWSKAQRFQQCLVFHMPNLSCTPYLVFTSPGGVPLWPREQCGSWADRGGCVPQPSLAGVLKYPSDAEAAMFSGLTGSIAIIFLVWHSEHTFPVMWNS